MPFPGLSAEQVVRIHHNAGGQVAIEGCWPCFVDVDEGMLGCKCDGQQSGKGFLNPTPGTRQECSNERAGAQVKALRNDAG